MALVPIWSKELTALKLGEEGEVSVVITFSLHSLIFLEENTVEVMESQRRGNRLNWTSLPRSAVVPQPKAAIPVLFAS